MASYVQSDYLAKLLLPKQYGNIHVKPNLSATNTIKETELAPSKPTNWLDVSTHAKTPASWSELDFTKEFFSINPEKEPETKPETEVSDDEEPRVKVPDFTYLDPENLDLEYDFELCDTLFSNTSIYKIHVCGYSISTECEIPFVKYLMELNGENFVFPHFDFTCPSNVGNQSGFFTDIWNKITGKEQQPQVQEPEEEEPATNQTYLLNECFKRIMTIMDVSDHSDPNLLNHMYKGFIKSKTEINVLYVFFDFGDLVIKSNDYHRSWAIIDEIRYVKKMLGFAIDPIISQLFKGNPGLTHIIDKNGFIIDTPYALYICKKDETTGVYVNIYSDDEDGEISIIEERTNHPIFGDFYLFSISPLDMQGRESHFKIKRYVGFTNNPLYILKNISTLVKEDRREDGYNYGSIYFQENTDKGTNVPFWIIKSPEAFSG